MNNRKEKFMEYVFLLTAAPETIFKRVGADQNRPVLNGRRSPEGIAQLMKERQPYYEAAADFVISTDNKSSENVAQEILDIFKKLR